MSEEFLDLTADDLDLLSEVPVCGCGRPAVALDAYRRVLVDAVAASDGDWSRNRLAAVDGDERAFHLVAGVLDHIDCIEHGSSINTAWATEKGRRLLAILVRYAESDYEAMPCTAT